MQTQTQPRREAESDFPADLFTDNPKEKRPARVTISRGREEILRFLREPKNYRHFLDEEGEFVLTPGADDLIVWRLGDEGHGAFALTAAPGGRGTVVTFKMEMAGEWSGLVARMVGRDADTRAAVALRKLKAYLETGEVPTTEGQPSGREEIQTH